jgi:hypothetical protein
MFIAHFGVALAAKKAAPEASLGTLVFAAQFADLAWPIFLLCGWEQVRIVPGDTRLTPLEFTSYPYSHSLVADLLWGVALGLVYFAFRRDPRSALIAAVCVPSHWVLDYIAHRPDLPIIPGGPVYGLGMWNSLPLTLAVEFALFAAGIAVYLRATRANDGIRQYALWSFAELPHRGLPRLGFRTATAECARPRDHCARDLAHCSVGRVGGPASNVGLLIGLVPDFANRTFAVGHL